MEDVLLVVVSTMEHQALSVEDFLQAIIYMNRRLEHHDSRYLGLVQANTESAQVMTQGLSDV